MAPTEGRAEAANGPEQSRLSRPSGMVEGARDHSRHLSGYSRCEAEAVRRGSEVTRRRINERFDGDEAPHPCRNPFVYANGPGIGRCCGHVCPARAPASQSGPHSSDGVPVGIQLQPRIRNWKGLHFFRSKPELRYEHIDLLFSKTIDWDLIETMLPEMLRVAVSIGAGRIKPSTILRRLATYSRKSKLYFAFRELGHAVRTGFLLDYLFDIELRRLIQTATNKSERFNQFLQWIAFGGGALAAEGIRDEQRKFIKYNHLVANLLIFHNVVSMSNALKRLAAEGYELDANLIACSSPYLTEHLNRFGRYALNRDRVPEPLESVREFKMPPRGEKPLRTAQVAV